MQCLEFHVFLDAPAAANEEEASEDILHAVKEAVQAATAGIDGKVEVVQLQLDSDNLCPAKFLVRLDDAGLNAARELRDIVLSGDFDAVAARALGNHCPFNFRADRSGLACQYEESVLALDSLTAHQREKLEACGTDFSHIHLHAPAGAGKTFVALHRALDMLQNPAEESNLVLYVARNEALSYFAAAWIGKRIKDKTKRSEYLGRLHVLYEPFENGICRVSVKDNRVMLHKGESTTFDHLQYALLIVDEAHNVYSNAASRACVEAYVSEDKTQRFLLSDVSQSLGRDIEYPAGLRDVELSEVVRCSKRIIAGAMAFQLGGTEKLLTKCTHESTGPPLKSFLFDVPASQAQTSDAFLAYAKHTVRALEHVITIFPNLSLHNRLAIVVPGAEFLEGFRPALCNALREEFPRRKLHLVDAAVASGDMGPSVPNHDDSSKPSIHDNEEHQDLEDGEWLVYDEINRLDGLERLIVLAVGLDSVIHAGEGDAGSMGSVDNEAIPLQTRSMLYRAVTRAHLMFLVVNEFLRGGWLEFLGSVRLRDDESFDSTAELKRTEVRAVEEFVRTELAKMISTTAAVENVKLDEQATSQLVSDAAKLEDKGQDRQWSVDFVLRSWRSAADMALTNLDTVIQQSGFALPPPSTFERIHATLSLAIYKGDLANVHATALDALKRWNESDRDARIKQALEVVSGAKTIDKEIQTLLFPRIVARVDQGESIPSAARAVLDDWSQIETQISSSLREQLRALELEIADDAILSLKVAAATVLFQGSSVPQAVETTIQKWRKSKAHGKLLAALESAIKSAVENEPIYKSGMPVRLHGLQSKPALNNEEGVLQGFQATKQRWVVKLHSSRVVALKEENLILQPEHTPCQLECSLENAMPLLIATLGDEALSDGNDSDDFSSAAAIVVSRWRRLEARIAAALEATALEKQLHLTAEALPTMVFKVINSLWSDHERERERDDGFGPLDENILERFQKEVASAIGEWECNENSLQAEHAHIESALEAKASVARILLTDAAKANLHRRVVMALRRGDDLETAVEKVIKEWERQLVRRQVQQTVWDPSANLTSKITGVVRFMPYKQSESGSVDFWTLTNVLAFLSFETMGLVARVCKRWRNAANDPSWKPELVAYAWGAEDVTGLSMRCTKPTLLPFSLDKQVMHISCADQATFALTETGNVWFWGQAWVPPVPGEEEQPCREPVQLKELSDIISISVCPAGYHHGRRGMRGYGCLAVTRQGSLYTWGHNSTGQLRHPTEYVRRPCRVNDGGDVWDPATQRVLHAACGLDYIALCIERRESSGQDPPLRSTAVISYGTFERYRGRPEDREWPELQGIALRQLVAGSFHCCALSTNGDLYTFGDERGRDESNGNLLGHRDAEGGLASGQRTKPPRRVVTHGLGPIAEVSSTTYATIAITVDGRVFSWGDCDGHALGHDVRYSDSPIWLQSLRWQQVSHGSLSYTNGAVATDEGRVFVWGGGAWEGGIAAGRNTPDAPSEIKWKGVPSCYQCSSVALAHRHGYLIFRKRP